MFKKIKELPGNLYRSIKYGIENLISWFPVIWKDRDWDDFYIYIILRKKLSNMEQYQRKYGISIEKENIADKIKLCVNLLDRIIKDDYGDMVFKKHDEKWGEIKFNFGEYINDEDVIYRTNTKSKENKKQESKEFKRLCEHERMLIKQDIDLLFKIMAKHVKEWWD